MIMIKPRRLILSLLPLASVGWSFSFSFSNKPTQCQNVTVTVDGGQAPYRLVLIPAGPIPEGQEIRTIIDQEFSSSPFTLPALAFPGGSNFTAIMSDATG